MTTILTIWVAGMPFAVGWLLWSLHDAPGDVWEEVISPAGFVAALLFALLWPVILADVVLKVWRGE